MLASLTADIAALGVVLAIIGLVWLYLKRECEDSPLIKVEVPLDDLGRLGVLIIFGVAGVGANEFWMGSEVGMLVIAALLTSFLIVMLLARYYPDSALGRAVSWVIGRKRELFARPSYVMAETLRAQGRFTEAILEIECQLAKAPHDFTGLILYAELAALECDNLPLAERAVEDILKGARRSQAEVAFALNKLAEWRVANHCDADAAAEPLSRLAGMFNNSRDARDARIRAEEIKAAATAGSARFSR